MRLNVIAADPKAAPEAPPLFIVHGLFGSAKNWSGIQKRIAQGTVCAPRRVIAVDLRNHGDSGWDADASYAALAADLAETIEAETGGAPADVLGHSMGGKTAMQLALTRPGLVSRLIVADIAPVAYSHGYHRRYIAAMKAVDLPAIRRRGEVEPLLREAAPERDVRAFLLTSLAFEDGAARWKLNLDALDAHMDQIVGWPGTEGVYEGKTLFIYGDQSDYVQQAYRPAIRAQFPHARFVAVKEAGHWLHAQQPEAFVQTVGGYLKATE